MQKPNSRLYIIQRYLHMSQYVENQAREDIPGGHGQEESDSQDEYDLEDSFVDDSEDSGEESAPPNSPVTLVNKKRKRIRIQDESDEPGQPGEPGEPGEPGKVHKVHAKECTVNNLQTKSTAKKNTTCNKTDANLIKLPAHISVEKHGKPLIYFLRGDEVVVVLYPHIGAATYTLLQGHIGEELSTFTIASTLDAHGIMDIFERYASYTILPKLHHVRVQIHSLLT